MAKYRDNPDAIRALLRETEVHKDLFIDDELFDLEMERLYANTLSLIHISIEGTATAAAIAMAIKVRRIGSTPDCSLNTGAILPRPKTRVN